MIPLIAGGQSAGKHQFSDAFNGGAGDDNYAQSLNDQAGGFGKHILL